MYEITVSVANLNVKINAIYPQTLLFCKPYQIMQPVQAHFSIRTSLEEIDSNRNDIMANDPSEVSSGPVVESSLLLQKMSDHMLDYNTVLIHGAVVAINGDAYLFTAKSGTGKTTHVLKWVKDIPGAYVLNGDKPLIIVDDKPKACGTPWNGKERIGCNKIVPLKAIVFMDRSEDNFIKKIPSSQAFPLLLGKTHRPKDSEKMKKTIKLLSALTKSVEFYSFKCNNFKNDCLEVSYRTLVGKHNKD